MKTRTAVVIGATGLVGSQLVRLLIKDDRFGSVKILGRRSFGIQHSKIEEHVINFNQPEQWKQFVTGDVLFSALGTTLKQAGGKEAQYIVDYTYQYNVAKAAAENGVPVYVLVSSAMADEHSRIFYTRMKGELERDVKQLPFAHIHILQPGMLVGARKEKRAGEKIGLAVLQALNSLGIAKKQKPVQDIIVAKAMINVSFKTDKHIDTHTLLEVFDEAKQ